jgi:hypothetical protein
MSQEETQSVIAAKARTTGKLMTDSELDRVTGGIISSFNPIDPAAKKVEEGPELAARIAGSL